MVRLRSVIRTLASILALLSGLISVPVIAESLLNTIALESSKTFYCGCEFAFNSSHRPVFSKINCGYRSRLQVNNTSVQVEHIVPVSTLANNLFCWRSGGRKGCEGDVEFEAMTTDLHNLVPVISEINRDRSNLKFGLVKGEPRLYGQCDFEIDRARGDVEVQESIRGDIARIYFYMNERYQLDLDEQLLQQFEAWSIADPVDEKERARNKRIIQHQGNTNQFVSASSNISTAFH